MGVQKWLDGQRGGLNFFYFLFFYKKLLEIWKVLNTIDQIAKI
jgi:hypothetical protein